MIEGSINHLGLIFWTFILFKSAKYMINPIILCLLEMQIIKPSCFIQNIQPRNFKVKPKLKVLYNKFHYYSSFVFITVLWVIHKINYKWLQVDYKWNTNSNLQGNNCFFFKSLCFIFKKFPIASHGILFILSCLPFVCTCDKRKEKTLANN